MLKFLGCLFVAGSLFCGVGFIFDWVDLHKNRDEARIELYLNTGKLSNDATCVKEFISDLFSDVN